MQIFQHFDYILSLPTFAIVAILGFMILKTVVKTLFKIVFFVILIILAIFFWKSVSGALRPHTAATTIVRYV